MFRTTRNIGRKPAKSFASAFAMAIALAGGATIGTAAYAPAASAQEYSREFVAAYQPMSVVANTEGGDVTPLVSQLPGLLALAKSADEQHAAGILLFTVGSKTENPALQRQGIELQLNSGKVTPERLAPLQWVLGNLAFNAQDYTTARTALEAAAAAGWNREDPTGLIAETYYLGGDVPGGLAYVQRHFDAGIAAGARPSEPLMVRALQAAYQADLKQPSLDIAQALVEEYPTQRNWTFALQVANALGDLEPAVMLDLLRLMRETGTLSNRAEYERYIEAADPRVMSNEIEDVLAAAASSGQIPASDQYYRDVNQIVQARKAADAREANAFYSEGMGDASLALTSGDVLYSLDDFARAEQVYAKAVDGPNAAAALTRMGIAQVKQGKFAEAQETFARVTGPRRLVAQFWEIYAADKAG